jgi:hypothetical protein
MTTTQAICESMGKRWKYKNEYCVLIDGKIYNLKNIFFLMMFAKLLQARLVEEGWTVCNYHSPTFGYSSQARRDPVEFPDFYFAESDDMDCEPKALVALYCKIHGIEVGNE